MPRAAFTVALLLLASGVAAAALSRPIPLKDVIAQEEIILTAEVTAREPDRPAVTLVVKDTLKGKAPADKLLVNMTGDADAAKDKHVPQLFDRLKPGRKLVLFVSKAGAKYTLFAFTEGTWFQGQGTIDGDKIRWALLHGEPYLRRTFAGTTAELADVVKQALAKTKAAPPLNAAEKPGFGPSASEDKKPEEKKPQARVMAGGPVLVGVIPSFVLVGPLALVAVFFPGLFARLAVAFTRWRAFLVVASVNSTLALVYYFTKDYLPAGGAGPVPLLVVAITAGGLVWAGRRYRTLADADPAVTHPARFGEVSTLLLVTAVLSLFVAAVGLLAGWGEVFRLPWRTFTELAVGVAAATLYAGYRAISETPADGVRLSLSGESVGLAAALAFGVGVLAFTGTPAAVAPVLGDVVTGDASTTEATGPKLADVRLLFETADAHEVLSAVTVTPDRLYFGTGRTRGFSQTGAVYAIDRTTGATAWAFTDDDNLKPAFATPAVAGGKVYAGEGLHQDAGRRLFCLDAATGKPAWPAPVKTTSHTEGMPAVADGRVTFPAGDDGVYCVDAATGAEVWHLPGGDETRLHIDTPAAVVGGRVYVGSGYRTLALLCLDAATGKELWRTPAPARSFGPPLVRGRFVYYGLGTGNLSEDLSGESEGLPAETEPKGVVMCLDAATGAEVWRVDLPKSVHTALAADGRTVYAAARDGVLYALDRSTGKLRWKRSIGSAFTAGPAVASYAGGSRAYAVYAVTTGGTAVCLDPATGATFWVRDLGAQFGRAVQVYSTPVVVDADPAGRTREVYVGAMLTDPAADTKSAAVVRLTDDAGE